MIVYIENTKDYTNILLEIMTESATCLPIESQIQCPFLYSTMLGMRLYKPQFLGAFAFRGDTGGKLINGRSKGTSSSFFCLFLFFYV